MKKIILFIVVAISVQTSAAQYVLYKEIDGVEFYSKWGHEKWLSKKSPKVLMVKIVNTGPTAVEFNLGVEFFSNLMMVEESPEKPFCLSAGKTLLPRMAALVFKPAGSSPEKLDSFELTGLELVRMEKSSCTK